MGKTVRYQVLGEGLKRKAGAHGMSKKAQRMADKRDLQDMTGREWGRTGRGWGQ